MTSNSVNFINKDDARRVLLSLLKQVADPRRADSYKHFYKIGTGDRKERNIRFTCDRSGQQGLARSRRPHQQHAFRDASAELLEFLRLAQELDDLFQLFFGFIDAGDVFERHFFLLHREQARAALAE